MIEVANNQKHSVRIKSLETGDYKGLTKSRYYFNWKTEKTNDLYKLVLRDEILGVISLFHHTDQRIEIKLLAVSKENRGKDKKYDRIAGTLIAFACREAVKRYGLEGCVSLVPKTRLKQHYIDSYGMKDAGMQIYLDGWAMLEILKEYEL